MIEFTREETVVLSERLRDWLAAELDVEIGGFDAEFLLEFVLRELGPRFYNRGIEDARTLLERRSGELAEALVELEVPEPR